MDHLRRKRLERAGVLPPLDVTDHPVLDDWRLQEWPHPVGGVTMLRDLQGGVRARVERHGKRWTWTVWGPDLLVLTSGTETSMKLARSASLAALGVTLDLPAPLPRPVMVDVLTERRVREQPWRRWRKRRLGKGGRKKGQTGSPR